MSENLKAKELFSLSLRSFRNKPQRAILTIAGMSVGIATVLLLVSLGYGLQYILIGKLMTTEDSLISMEVFYPSERNILIREHTLAEIREYEDVAEVSPVSEFPGEVNEGAIDSTGVLINVRIIEPSYFRLSGLVPDIGKAPVEGENGLVISSQTLIALGMEADETALGTPLEFTVFFEDEVSSTFDEVHSRGQIPIMGIINDDTTTAIIFSEALTETRPYYTKMMVKADNTEVIEKLRDNLLEQGFLVSARIDLVTQARKITNILTMILGVFGVTALVVSAIGMFNTMLVGFLERIYEVGILKSLGATDYNVRNLFLVEASIMGLLGGLGGVALGIGAGKILNIVLTIFSQRFGGKAIELFMVPWWFVGLVLAISAIIGFVSGWWPAHRATGLSPKEAFNKR
ncbi:MAG TPA: FtsX-like permease family protein [Candidatus Paceibacterota bacterium]|nr:FtsX-like permease family protein [Candidatus Paceibacterota bacterium]